MMADRWDKVYIDMAAEFDSMFEMIDPGLRGWLGRGLVGEPLRRLALGSQLALHLDEEMGR